MQIFLGDVMNDCWEKIRTNLFVVVASSPFQKPVKSDFEGKENETANCVEDSFSTFEGSSSSTETQASIWFF